MSESAARARMSSPGPGPDAAPDPGLPQGGGPSSGLDARFAPGEDIRPLLRSIAGGLIGGALSFAVDGLIPLASLATFDPIGQVAVPLPRGMLWPAMWADAVLGDPRQTAAGIAIGLVLATLVAFGYAYGQVRRFLPGPAWLRGLGLAAALGLVAVPALLPRAATWLAAGMAGGGAAPAWLAGAALILAKIGLGLAVYGLVVGLLNPPASRRA